MDEKQYQIMITPFAENSMREIVQYIARELLAPESAVKLLRTLQVTSKNSPAAEQRSFSASTSV